MKRTFFIWILALCSYLAKAQIITIKESTTGEPLELVTIISQRPQLLELTNAKGQADLGKFKVAEAIEIRLLGYRALRTDFIKLEKAGFEVALEKSNIGLQQVNISATRWRQPSRENPQRVTSISSRDVALQQPQTAADLLGTSGEVFVQKSQLGGGSPMIRGFATNRLLYSVDGVRMNTAIFRGGNIQNVIALDPFAIENTEVLFGPGSVLYGSDAIGAVMSFQTLAPQFSLSDNTLISGTATGRYSSAGKEKTGHFDVKVGWKKWALVTSFSNFDFGDLEMGSQGSDQYLRTFSVQRIDTSDVAIANPDPEVQAGSGYSQVNLMQKIAYKPSESWNFEYAFHYSESSNVPRYDRLIRTRDGIPRNAEWNYGPQIWMMNQLSINHKSTGKIFDEVCVRFAQQSFEESRIIRGFNAADRATQIEEVLALSANVDFIKNISPKSRMYYGLEAVYNDVKSSGKTVNIRSEETKISASRYPQSEWSSYGAYASLQTDLKPNLVLQAGARYNTFGIEADFRNNLAFYPLPYAQASLSNGALTGSAGLVYRPSERWSLTANLSTGFRAPNIDDIGKIFDSEAGSVVVPNPDLEAEYAYNAEIGIARVIGESVKLDLTGYYTLLENALVRRAFTIGGSDSILYVGELSRVQAIQNAARASVFGVQAGIEIKLPEGFSFSSRLNFQKGEEELDNGDTSPSRHAAPLFGQSRFTYQLGELTLQAYAQYSASVKPENLAVEEQGKPEIYLVNASGELYSEGWYTLNFKALYRLNGNFAVSAGLENITDRRYRPYSSGIVASGRNFLLALTVKF